MAAAHWLSVPLSPQVSEVQYEKMGYLWSVRKLIHSNDDAPKEKEPPALYKEAACIEIHF